MKRGGDESGGAWGSGGGSRVGRERRSGEAKKEGKKSRDNVGDPRQWCTRGDYGTVRVGPSADGSRGEPSLGIRRTRCPALGRLLPSSIGVVQSIGGRPPPSSKSLLVPDRIGLDRNGTVPPVHPLIPHRCVSADTATTMRLRRWYSW